MDDKMRELLKSKGREDLIATHDLLATGYAGIDKDGNIVDRRENQDAIPIQKSSVFPNTPEPKEINP